jgi:outer membrane immunogenic protein
MKYLLYVIDTYLECLEEIYEMKSIAITAAIILCASSVSAADFVYQEPAAPVEVAPAFSWTGFTAGIQGGYNWNDLSMSTSLYPGVEAGTDVDGGLFGGFVGYNHQLDNNWVIGAEADFEGNWAEDSVVVAPDTLEYGLDWQGSVRARAGFAMDRALIYGTAGWAYGRGYAEVVGLGKETENFNGLTVGAGVDYAFTDNVFARLEYRYTNFGEKNYQAYGETFELDVDQHAVKVGLGVKF